MKNIHYYLLLLLTGLILVNCSGKAVVNPEEIDYIFDYRTNTCYAVAGKDDGPESTLGLATTECSKVLHLLDLEEGKQPKFGNGTIPSQPIPTTLPESFNQTNDFPAVQVQSQQPQTTEQKLASISKLELDNFCKNRFGDVLKNLTPEEYINIIRKYLPKGMMLTTVRRKSIKIFY